MWKVVEVKDDKDDFLYMLLLGVHIVQKSASRMCCVLLKKLEVANLRSVDSHKRELCFH